MKTPSIIATHAALALLVALPLPAAPPSGTLYWGASGSGGAGAWEDTNAWWDGSAPLTWVSGTAGTVQTYINFVFSGTGRDAGDPYVITTALSQIASGHPGSTPEMHTVLFDFRDNYLFNSTIGTGTTVLGAVAAAGKVAVRVDEGKTVSFDGGTGGIRIISAAGFTGESTVLFSGNGTINLGKNVSAEDTQASGNGRVAVGNVVYQGTTVLQVNAPTVNMNDVTTKITAHRLYVDAGTLNINGGTVSMQGTQRASATDSMPFHIGGAVRHEAVPEASRAVVNLNSGYIYSSGSHAGYNGLTFAYYNTKNSVAGSQIQNNGAGGTFNLNGGVFETSNIYANPDATNATTRFVFNGGTLRPAAAASSAQLGAFIDGFKTSAEDSTGGKALVTGMGGAFIDTGAITDKTAVILSEIQGSGNLVKLGDNTLRLSATNTYTGTTIVRGGTLSMNVVDAIAASSAVVVESGAVLNGSGGGVTQTLRNLSGSGTLTNGSGRLIAFNDAGESSTFAGTLALGSGGFGKIGDGTLILTADNAANSRTIVVSAGRLFLGDAAGAKLGSLVTVESGAIFGGLGTATGTVALNSGGILQSGTGAAAGALTVATLQLNAGSILGFNIDTGNASGSLSVTNPIVFLSGAAAADITLNLNALVSGTYNLGNIVSLENAVVKYDGLSIGGRQSADLDVVGGNSLQLTLDAGSSLKVIWTGQNDGTWDLSGTNWKKESDSGAVPFAFGDTVVFDDSLATGRRDITLATDITVSDMIVGGTGNYSFTGRAIIADEHSINGGSLTGATGRLVMNSTGTLTLAPTGTNDFKGGIDLQKGMLVAATPGALGTANITGGGTLSKTGADTLELATEKIAATVALNVDEGTLRLSKTAAGAYTFANTLTGDGTLAVRLAGAGAADTLTLGADATGGFAGTLLIENAAFTLDTTSAARLATATLGVGAGSRIDKTAGDMTLAGLALDGGTMQFAVDGISPDGLLTVGALSTGSAGVETSVMMDLAGAGGFTQFNPAVPPATNILDHDNGSATGEKIIAVTGAITGAGTLKLTGTDGNPVAGSITAVIEQYVPGGTTDRENVADAAYSAALVTGADGVYLGSALTAISVYEGKQLVLDNSAPGVDNAFTIGIGGAGGLTVQAGGTIVLSGSNTYTGITTLASGVTRATRADIFKDSASVAIEAGAGFETGGNAQTLRNLSGGGALDLGGAALTLAAADGAATEFSGALTGAGGITKTGGGTLTLSGESARGAGTTTIAAGRLVVKNNFSALGSGVTSFSSPTAVLEFSGIASGTYNLAVAGGGIVEIRDSNFTFGNSGNRLSQLNLINSTVLPTASVHALGSTTAHVRVDSTSALYVSYGNSTNTNALRVGNVTVAAGGKLLYGLNGAVNQFDLSNGGVLTLEDGAVIGFAGPVADGVFDLVQENTGTIVRQGALLLDKGPNKMVQWRATDNGDIELITLSFDPTVQVSMTFDVMMAAMSAVYNRMGESFLLPVIEANRATKINGLWMRGFASSAEYDETPDQYGHTEDTYGVVVGFDALSRNRKYLMGVYGGFAGSTLETDANARGEADQQFAGLYGAAKWGGFYMGIDGMAGWSKSDNTRHQSDGGVSKGTSNANYYGGNVEAGLVFQPTQTFTFKLAAGLRYLNAEFGASKERGDSAVAYPDIDQDLLQVLVSEQASWKFTMPWGRPGVVDLTYAWRQNISEKSGDVIVRFVSDTTQAPYVIRGGNYTRGGHVIGGGIRGMVNDALSLGLAYDFEIASHRSRHTVNGTVRWSW